MTSEQSTPAPAANQKPVKKPEKKKKRKKFPPQSEAYRFYPAASEGLSEADAAQRREDGYANVSVKSTSKTIPMIIATNLFTYYNLLFALIAAALIIEKSYNNLTFLAIIIANIIIGTVQEINSKLTLDKLNLLSAPKATVIRGSVTKTVPTDELVLDDVVIFASGNQICADAILLEGEVTVNEALVTGESDEITKRPGDVLLSGSFIINGKCAAKLDRVGHESFVSKLTSDAKKIKKKQQPGMMRSLTLLVQIIGVIIIPFAVVLFLNQTRSLGMDSKSAVESTAAAILGMIPEGLYLLTSVALAVSVMRLAKKKTLVHELKCIEALARVDVLCVDKTGTITEDKMQVTGLTVLEPEKFSAPVIEAVMRDFTFNMEADNATMKSLKEYFKPQNQRRAAAVLGFSSATKYSAVSFSAQESYILGAPEFILRSDYNRWREVIEAHSSSGERVLLLALIDQSGGDIFRGQPLGRVYPAAIITLANKIRPEAKATVEYFRSQGVKIKVISGDNPLTVSAAASQAGVEGAEKYVDATTLDTKEKIARGVLEYNVFGRVTPDQKRQFIRALKKAGHTVAMTGDGVNDVLALKDSDCSIAMASGSEAACNVSDLVLLDSNFASMPAVVAEGRRVINNVERAAALFLVKNIFSFVLAFAALFINYAYPFTPNQLSLVNALMIGVPSFFLALEPNTELVRGKFLRNVLFRAFPAAITDIFVVTGTMLFAYAFGIPYGEMSTVAIVLFGAVAFLMLMRVCKPFNWMRITLLCAMGGAFILSLIFLGWFFTLSALSLGSVLVMIVFLMLAPTVMNLTIKAFDICGSKVTKLENKLKKRREEKKAAA